MKTLPNALIIGAAKSGTTSLFEYLKQHPEIYGPEIKEPNFFAYRNTQPTAIGYGPKNRLYHFLYNKTVTSAEEYERLFAGSNGEEILLEASPRYLYYRRAPDRISESLPQCKLIVILRDPVERAFSHYCMMRYFGFEPLDFEQALEREDERIAAGWGWDWHYLRVGRYFAQLKRYYDRYPADQIRVYDYRFLESDPQGLLRSIREFLGVDPGYRIDTTNRYKSLNSGKYWSDPHMRCLRYRLIRQFEDEVPALEQLTGCDFSHWLD